MIYEEPVAAVSWYDEIYQASGEYETPIDPAT